jgi:hypothetical protein
MAESRPSAVLAPEAFPRFQCPMSFAVSRFANDDDCLSNQLLWCVMLAMPARICRLPFPVSTTSRSSFLDLATFSAWRTVAVFSLIFFEVVQADFFVFCCCGLFGFGCAELCHLPGDCFIVDLWKEDFGLFCDSTFEQFWECGFVPRS